MTDLDLMNAFIMQQIIKKKLPNVEGTIQDKRKQKEHFAQLVKSVESISNGQALLSYDDDNICKFNIIIQPQEGPYNQGQFVFHVEMTKTYPLTAPRVSCITKIYHPNIDDEGDICLSVVNDWKSNKNDLVDCLQGLLYIMINPNLEDPLSPYFAPGEDVEIFLKNVKMSMHGKEVNGAYFDKVIF